MNEQIVMTRVIPAGYPTVAPYHPLAAFPEYPFPGQLGLDFNFVYSGVRRLLYQLRLDQARFDTPAWNPLGEFLKPGMTVVLKPNFVAHRNRGGGDLYAVITHPSVIRAVADYCYIALQGEGRIIVADAPQYDCDWAKLMDITGLPQVADLYGGMMTLLDLRSYWSKGRHLASQLEPLPGDPKGATMVDLGDHSLFAGMDVDRVDRMVGACYWRGDLAGYHSGKRHRYVLSRTVPEADLVISLPKMKTHKKAGVTLNLKNLVGICTDKNCLPHYTLGPPSEGGDQYPDKLWAPHEQALIGLERWMYDHLLARQVPVLDWLHQAIYWLHNHTTRKLGLKVDEHKRALDAGNWYGNDTTWRMVADLYAAFDCVCQGRTFSIVDGVIGGEGNGPLAPDPVLAGLLIGGENLLAVDVFAAHLMGFDPLRLPLYHHFCKLHMFEEHSGLHFRPHPGWVGHVEAAQCV